MNGDELGITKSKSYDFGDCSSKEFPGAIPDSGAEVSSRKSHVPQSTPRLRVSHNLTDSPP